MCHRGFIEVLHECYLIFHVLSCNFSNTFLVLSYYFPIIFPVQSLYFGHNFLVLSLYFLCFSQLFLSTFLILLQCCYGTFTKLSTYFPVLPSCFFSSIFWFFPGTLPVLYLYFPFTIEVFS